MIFLKLALNCIFKKSLNILLLHFYILFLIYFRYASLYFCCAVEQCDNELLTLEIIHRYVELLDKYFGSVSVLIIIVFLLLLFYNCDFLF